MKSKKYVPRLTEANLYVYLLIISTYSSGNSYKIYSTKSKLDNAIQRYRLGKDYDWHQWEKIIIQ